MGKCSMGVMVAPYGAAHFNGDCPNSNIIHPAANHNMSRSSRVYSIALEAYSISSPVFVASQNARLEHDQTHARCELQNK